jgi:hypothetical protein
VETCRGPPSPRCSSLRLASKPREGEHGTFLEHIVGTEEVVDSFHYGADAPDWPYYPILSRALRCGDHVKWRYEILVRVWKGRHGDGGEAGEGVGSEEPRKGKGKERMERGKTQLEKGISRREVAAPAPHHHAYARQK